MLVGILKEDEGRVAITPANLPPLTAAGVDVILESGAGAAAGFSDNAYEQKGAHIATTRDAVLEADVLLTVRASSLGEVRTGQTIIGLADPLTARAEVEALAKRGVTLFALELLPRISRAQTMDVLSSMATIAGYKAVLIAAERLPKLFPMMMTAAGTISPAKVLVIGAGVAGLQAIAMARRLGAIVTAYDVRPEVKEEVESLGARFAEIALDTTEEDAQDARGYAKSLGEDVYEQQRVLMERIVSAADVVVTTAAVPGREAPRLITKEMVEKMAAGSVIVDLAAASGGNCELTEPDATVEHHGVHVIGPTNLPATVPFHASQMYGKNIVSFLTNIIVDGELRIDVDDELVRETLVARDGAIVHRRLLES